jgi:biopolymer transport protein TolQ
MHEMNKLQSGMGILATTAAISPLLGLLGTVWGIMYSFINIGQQGSASIATVAPGIAEALVTTIAGLVVAIPAMVGHNFLMGSVFNCLDYIERTAEFAKSLFNKEPRV